MLLTEQEARTKWCPFIHTRITVVLPAGDRQSEQRAERLGRDDRCMSSLCMAWRGQDNFEWKGLGEFIVGDLTPDAVEAAVAKAREQGWDVAHPRADQYCGVSLVVGRKIGIMGYCGLAGAPQ